MSTDKDKTGGGAGDRPVLFGPPNDPALADRISKLTGPALDTAMARLQTFSDDVFGDEEGEDPNPFGADDALQAPLNPESPTRPGRISHEPDQEDEAAADGLDRILDSLSEDPDPAPPAKPARSLFDLEAERMTDEPVLAGPTSPIATVLARSGGAGTAEPDPDGDGDGQYPDDPAYDPLSDLDEPDLLSAGGLDTDLPDQDQDPLEQGLLHGGLGFPESDPDFPDDDPDFPDDDQDSEDAGLLSALPVRPGSASDVLLDLWADEPGPESPDAGSLFEERTGGGSGQDRSYGLPEPSPYGDRDGMGGLFPDEDEPGPERTWASLPEPEGLRETDEGATDWMMRKTEEGAQAQTPSVPAAPPREPAPPIGKTDLSGSALDGLITDLRWGRPAAEETVASAPVAPADGPPVEPEPPASEPTSAAARRSLLPSFLRRGGSRPRLGPLSEPPVSTAPAPTGPAPDPAPHLAPEGWPDGLPREPELALVPQGDEEPGAEPPIGAADAAEGGERKRGGARKRLLAGVALFGVLAAAGAGAWLMGSGPDARIRVADNVLIPVTPAPDTANRADASAAGGPVTAGPSPVWTALDPDRPTLLPPPESAASPDADGTVPGVPPDPEVALEGPAPISADTLVSAPTGPGPDASGPVMSADVAQGPAPEVSDLLAEINRARPPAAGTPTAEEVAALRSRLTDMETTARAAEDRSVELYNELTGLTDQITGLLQRDSDQAERLERMERLIRGQSAILSQFGQMEESLEQTQVVLLDVSARIGAVEGKNPADRDAVNRALADVESRLQALTANMSILARMSIEGVDVLRAPGASSGAAGVQTAPVTSDQRTGGADPVFRTETGGFRISSDAAGRVPAGVKKDDFIEGYGYVLDVLPASDGQRLVVMENGSVLIPAAE